MRFEFGNNWLNYSKEINNKKITSSRKRLEEMLPIDIKNNTFIDIGCGSGIHSLSAILSGATVFSFDYDSNSVLSSKNLRKKMHISEGLWKIEQGDILDENYIRTLDKYDIVYSWGVLHHSGEMWKALQNICHLVKEDGFLFIAIYNDQGWKSKFWWYIKWVYNILPIGINKVFAYILGTLFQILNIIKYILLLKPMVALKPLIEYGNDRGMNYFIDIVDWYGGFPFEYTTIEKLNAFFKDNNFEMIKCKKTNSLGCNEIVYQKKVVLSGE